MRLRIGIVIGVVLWVSACRTIPPIPEQQEGGSVARVAATLIGVPYHYGGATPRGFDCSGLVVYSYGRAGVGVPRTVAEQSRAAHPIPIDALSPGDVVFFHLKARHIDHVGIYTGSGRFIHAPSSGGVVSYAQLDDPYYRKHLASAGRFGNSGPALQSTARLR